MRSHGMLPAVSITVGLLLGFLVGSPLWAQGYEIRGQSVVVDTDMHWWSWAYHPDSLEVTSDGWVRPVQGGGELTMTSGLIQVSNEAQNLTTIEWEAEMPTGTRIEIRTRSGDKL